MLKRLSIPIVLIVALLSANAAIWSAYAAEADGVLRVSFLDVGQGDAILIQSPLGNQVLIDGGGTREVLRRLGEAMPFHDRSIDVVIATHPDEDHVGGLMGVLEAYEAGVLIESGADSDRGLDDELRSLAEARGAKILVAKRGMEVDLGGGAKLSILYPDRDASDLETNAASVVARLDYGEASFVFMGDAPQGVERFLIYKDGDSLRAGVLKVGHHGSKTSTSEEFVGAVAPAFAVISAGKDNKYGHPHREALDALEAAKAEIASTAELGTITFESDGVSIVKK